MGWTFSVAAACWLSFPRRDRRIATSRERFTAVLGARPRARILLGASTGSEWVARHLETLGHEVIVADPNDAPMYATRSRRSRSQRRHRHRARARPPPLGEKRRHKLRDALRRHELPERRLPLRVQRAVHIEANLVYGGHQHFYRGSAHHAPTSA